jgi:hypothetical protein
VHSMGDQSGWSVDIGYDDHGTNNTHQVPGQHNLNGPPPGFQACAPAGFDAAWGATQADGVTVTYGGDKTQLSGCSNFAYTLQKDGDDCGQPGSDPSPPAPSVIHPTCDVNSPGTWTVHVAWHNTNTGNNDSADVKLGDPPAS